MICFSLNLRSGRLLRHVPRQKPLSAHALRCKDTQKVDNQWRVVNFFEQKSAFSSGRRILLSSTAFRANPLRENLQCSQKILRCSRKIAQCLQESRQRQMPKKEIRDFFVGDSAYLWQRYALSPAKKRYISKCCVDDIINGQHGFRFIRSIRVLIYLRTRIALIYRIYLVITTLSEDKKLRAIRGIRVLIYLRTRIALIYRMYLGDNNSKRR